MTRDAHQGLARLVADLWASADTVGRAFARPHGWLVTPAAGGGNGVVFRAERPGEACAVKVSPVDERDRGGREYAALARLARDLHVAPRPCALVRAPDGLPVSVLVTSWLDGAPLSVPPRPVVGPAAGPGDVGCLTDLVGLLADVHNRTSCVVDGMRPAVLGTSPGEVLDRARWYAAQAADPSIDMLITAVDDRTGTTGDTAPRALVHGDMNLANVLVTRAGLRLVDWEYAGQGDPCSDIADLCTHAGALGRRPDLWPGLVRAYVDHLVGDRARAARRIWVYVRAFTVYWAAMSRARARQPPDRLRGTRRYSPGELDAQADRYASLTRDLLSAP